MSINYITKRFTLAAALLLLSTQFCHAHVHTLAEADTIIAILLFVVVLLSMLGAFGLRHSKIVHQRNEQLLRILHTLDDYHAIVGDKAVTLNKQEEMTKERFPKPTTAKAAQTDGCHAFYVKMDARLNKEKPFTAPDFDQKALAEFMEVSLELFRKLVPRFKEPDRTLDYINSLRAEYGAKLLMEQSGRLDEDIASMCGFCNVAAFHKAFKFAFGITPTDYQNGMTKMFKNE